MVSHMLSHNAILMCYLYYCAHNISILLHLCYSIAPHSSYVLSMLLPLLVLYAICPIMSPISLPPYQANANPPPSTCMVQYGISIQPLPPIPYHTFYSLNILQLQPSCVASPVAQHPTIHRCCLHLEYHLAHKARGSVVHFTEAGLLREVQSSRICFS